MKAAEISRTSRMSRTSIAKVLLLRAETVGAEATAVEIVVDAADAAAEVGVAGDGADAMAVVEEADDMVAGMVVGADTRKIFLIVDFFIVD